ncbi:MAG: nitrous oxide-stimulated promoter family protein [Clostridia bacterium]|nr:nitrous oxide-stimulated promoter family protein [Clostridia bacterium]
MIKITKEKETITLMIKLYCNKKHHTKEKLCKECVAIKKYAHARLNRCPFGDEKSFCSKCPLGGCYEKSKREEIKKIMKYSGPRIILYRLKTVVEHFFRG